MRNPNSYSYRNQNAIDYNDSDSDEDEDNPGQKFTQNGNADEGSKRHPKKRKLESFVSNYKLRETWSEDEIYALLEVWGERYIELGRRSLRADDWADVTEKVLEMCGAEKTEAECRNQMDVLKNKYKKEREKVESGHGSKWAFFKKMDMLLDVRLMRGHGGEGLGCGVDSGEYVFMNPSVYLDRSNVLDEMRDSPGESDEEGDSDEDEDEDGDRDGESAKVLADSIARFGEIYEKIEENKRKQMVELETMRQDFHRELELQKKEIVERAQAEIAKIREMDNEDDDNADTDTSVED